MIRVAQRDREAMPCRCDSGVPHEPQSAVNTPPDRRHPVHARGQSLKRLTLMPTSSCVFDVPDHAKPSGLEGPVGRFGKVNELAPAVAGFSKPGVSIAFAARAALSFFSVNSLMATS